MSRKLFAVVGVMVLAAALCVGIWLRPSVPDDPQPRFTLALHIDGDVVSVVRRLPFRIIVDPVPDAVYLWVAPDGIDATDDENVLTVTRAPKGNLVFRVIVVTVQGGRLIKQRGIITVSIGDLPPVPPDPGPTPPNPPVPPPDDAPIDGNGLHVLLVYESDGEGNVKLPPAQLLAMHSADVRSYLNAKCPLGPDGKQHEWWMLDQNADVSGLPKKWQDAMKRPRSGVPWVIISNRGHNPAKFEGKLPATKDEFLNLLKKYGD